MLNEKEKYRYDRHLKMAEIGEPGQVKLKASSVLVIGIGGLGCPAVMYLAAAGVGRIGIIDFDTVNETNLQRQILFTTNDIGNNKAIAAAERLKLLNQHIITEAHSYKLTTKNALELFSKYDLIIDATDNFSTRYLVNDACVLTNKPLVYGSVYKFEGQVSVFNYKNGPSYRCLFPDPAKNIPSCEEVGVLGVLCGIIGTKQANEALKIILGIGNTLSGKLEIYKSLSSESLLLKIKRNDKVIQKVRDEKEKFVDYDYDLFCGIESDTTFSINKDDFKQQLFEKSLQLIDIRDEWEEPKITYEDLIAIPMQRIDEIVPNLSPTKKIVVICQNGLRSKVAVEYLRKKYKFTNVANLIDGLASLNLGTD